MLQELLGLATTSIFIENILLANFLGMCSFLAVSKRVDTAMGLGLAVTFVLGITGPVNWVINEYLLSPKSLAWLGADFAEVDLSFLRFITFIAVIAAMVQLVEMIIEKSSPSLYNALGIFLPLISVNCAILGVCLFIVERQYGFAEATVFSVSSGIGWWLAIVTMAAIREKLTYSHMPKGLEGLGITMITTGLMAMGFMCFAGINLKKEKSADEETTAQVAPADDDDVRLARSPGSLLNDPFKRLPGVSEGLSPAPPPSGVNPAGAPTRERSLFDQQAARPADASGRQP